MKTLSGVLAAATLMIAPASAFSHGQKKADTTKPDTDTTETFEETTTSQGRLGIEVMNLTPELRKHFSTFNDRGVLVAKVDKNGAGYKAGLQVGDILCAVNGHAVKRAGDVLDALANTKEGQKIKLDIVRDKKEITASATMLAPGPTTSELEFMHGMPWFGDQNT